MRRIRRKGASNDHSLRDFEAELVRYSDMQFGQTAYRFIRVDMLSGGFLKIKKILGTFEYFDAPIRGEFRCNDERLNKIFDTAAYTLKLCVHNGMVWDGAKRDRLVWIGDIHPEMLGLLSLYGEQNCIKNSLRFIREQTPLPAFMNRIPSYSLWWIIALSDYYRYTADATFLRENAAYLSSLVVQLDFCVDEAGEVHFPESPDQFFFDDLSETGKSCGNICAFVFRIAKTVTACRYRRDKARKDSETMSTRQV